MISSICESFYHTLDPKPVLHELSDFKLDVHTADGSTLPYSGYIETEISLPFQVEGQSSILFPI